MGLLFVAIGVLACLAPAQGDTWWLLRAGQEIWTTGVVPVTDTYSYTAAGRPWPNHESLTEAIFYLMFRAGGLPLLTLMCAVLIVGAWVLSWRFTRGPFELRFLLFATSLTACVGSWALRPQVFTMAAIVSVAALLATGRWWWLPPIIVVWTNLHGAVALGLVAIFAVLLVETWRLRRVPTRLTLAAAACVLSTLISPLGPGLWTFIVESMERSRVNQIIEWRAPDFTPTLWIFWVVAAALPIVAFRSRRHLDAQTLRWTAISLALLPLAARAVRNVPIFLLVAVPALTAAASARRGPETARTPRGENLRVNGALLVGAVAIGVLVVALSWRASIQQLGWHPVSPGAVEAVTTCPDPIYNTFEQGGALIWFLPGRQVFIDNRQDPYPAELLRRSRIAEQTGDYADLFEEFGVRCAVLPADSPIIAALGADPNWTRTFRDDDLSVFARGSE